MAGRPGTRGVTKRYNKRIMLTDNQQSELTARIQTVLSPEGLQGDKRDAALQAVMQIIADGLPYYKWVGVYFHDNGVLNLGPYVGAETEHTLIPVGTGVCGTAVAENRNVLVDDVRELTNYLACSTQTRSEIVVLIHDAQTGQILGQIDADGHEVGAFDQSDERFLEGVARLIAPHLLAPVGDTTAEAAR